jgi:hypothetical protein
LAESSTQDSPSAIGDYNGGGGVALRDLGWDHFAAEESGDLGKSTFKVGILLSSLKIKY